MYSNEHIHKLGYQYWTGIDVSKNAKPTAFDNLLYTLRYQIGHMFLRYVGWNFVGRQNDRQGFGGYTAGNTLSGIPFIDAPLHLTHYESRADGCTRYYGLPLLLAILGMTVLLGRRWRQAAFVIMSLAVMGGPALAIYLNMPPYEPRERDYVFLMFYAAMSMAAGVGVYTAMRKNGAIRTATVAAAGAIVCLMAFEAWPGHDKSGDTLPDGIASSLLNLCPNNAILLVEGDNDTYPLWYAQEVLRIRRDVRVVNYGLLGAPWYARQLTRAAHESPPIKLHWADEAINDELYGAIIGTGSTDTLTMDDAILLTEGYVLMPSPFLRTTAADSTFTINLSATDEIDISALLLTDIITSNPDRPLCSLPNIIPEETGITQHLDGPACLQRLCPPRAEFTPSALWHQMHACLRLPFADRYNMTYDESRLLRTLRLRETIADVAEAALADGHESDCRKALFASLSWMPASKAPNDVDLIRTAQLLFATGDNAVARDVLSHVANYVADQLAWAAQIAHDDMPSAQCVIDNEAELTQFLIRTMKATDNADMAAGLLNLAEQLGIEM